MNKDEHRSLDNKRCKYNNSFAVYVLNKKKDRKEKNRHDNTLRKSNNLLKS